MILTTCKYFDLVGNRCSRVTDGKCNDLQDCEFKYIAELKAENAELREKLKGCMFCGFGCHLEKYPNRFQRLAETHPKQYDYIINILGMGKVLDFIDVEYRPNIDKGQVKLKFKEEE